MTDDDQQEPTPTPDEVLDHLKDMLGDSRMELYLKMADIVRDKWLAYTAKGFSDQQALFLVCWEFFGVKVPV